MSMRFDDPAAEFVPAVERVFGKQPRVLDGSRAVLVDEGDRVAGGAVLVELDE